MTRPPAPISSVLLRLVPPLYAPCRGLGISRSIPMLPSIERESVTKPSLRQGIRHLPSREACSGRIFPLNLSHVDHYLRRLSERARARVAHARALRAAGVRGHGAGAGGSRGRGTGHSLDTAVSGKCPASRPLPTRGIFRCWDVFSFARDIR